MNIEPAATRFREAIKRLFLSKAEAARRAAGRLEALQRQEVEAERLDRLRNPDDYQGK